MHKRFLILAALALSACSQPASPPAAEAPSTAPAPAVAAALPTDAWVYKWIGVEGNTLTISKTDQAGVYAIEEVTLDGPKSYTGTADGDHINFVDGGKSGTITAGNGEATGLKDIRTKYDCLVIEFGKRGFCRD